MAKILLILNAVIALVLGLACVFAPMLVLSQFGVETRVPELHMARFFGAAMASLGLVLWFAKDAADAQVQKGLSMAMLGATVLALIVTIIGVAFDGVLRNFGWLVIVIEVVFGLGYVFVLFLQPRMK